MNGKNNKKNVENQTASVASVKEAKETTRALSKKRRIVYWSLAGFILILSVYLGLQLTQKEPLVLDDLVEFDYTVNHINQNDETKDYTVRIETEAEEVEEWVELAEQVTQTIRDYENQDDTRVVVSIFDTSEPGVAVESESQETESESQGTESTPSDIVGTIPDLEDEQHQITIEITEVVKLYRLLNKSLLEADINATSNWEIYGSKRVEDKHLVGSVALMEGVTEDEVYRQLKAIESEMVRFNELPEGGQTYFDYEQEEGRLWYAYSSVYPTSLIQIEQQEIRTTQTVE